MLKGGARLAYPTEGSYDPRHGTVDLRVCPGWNWDEVNGDKVLWVVQSDAERNNLTVTVNGEQIACKDEMVSIKSESGRINVRCAY
jgi:hypothetical protein